MRLAAGDTLVIATHNQGKVREIEAMLAPYRLTLRSAAELGLAEPEETGDTFEANAMLKATLAAAASRLPAIGDDSGLAVEALGGAPGIFSARWAERAGGGKRDFNAAMAKVEEGLLAAGATERDRRAAKFVAVVALADPAGATELFRGEVEGHIVWPPRGDRGFGYDPIFVPDGDARTFAEFDPAEKDRVSHRARAIAQFAAKVLA